MIERECIDFEKCKGCDRITTIIWKYGAPVRVCSVYEFPRIKWRIMECPFNRTVIESKKKKVRIGQKKGGGKLWKS